MVSTSRNFISSLILGDAICMSTGWKHKTPTLVWNTPSLVWNTPCPVWNSGILGIERAISLSGQP
jgi:hypothetical protein